RTTRSKRLFERAKVLKRPIKNLLMDANFIVGVGNIYASEALFRARIHPAMPTNLLSHEDWQRLLSNIRRVLNKAIQKGGTTLNDFVNSHGEMGYFQLSLAVYDREGQPCPKCRSEIERVVQLGRSTYFCRQCQPFDSTT
ncbi:bifunctional DNA-formamidopyrimidine glycosylase/DNA-(apurinic or apyrimidinic site) lyase, partial [bacterium]|nr:bifunctional DNA-formamidopyrimidine glycosylase/DNA-(apurinic or apyrimidinic site) lyase [bacterium]